MRKTGLIAAALLVAAALPLAAASDAMAQHRGGGGGISAGRGGGGGGFRGGAMMGGGAFRGGMGGGAFRGGMGAGPRFAGGPRAGIGAGWAGGRPGWNGPRSGWNGGYYRNRGPGFYGPGLALGTGLLLGGAYAASPYYYDDYDPYYYDAPAPVVGAIGPSGDDEAYCRRRYRSYDPASGTYLNNDGNRYPCP